MTELNDERLPPLGERTPGRARRSAAGPRWFQRPTVAGLGGIAVGLLVGIGLAAVVGDGSERTAGDVDAPVATTAPRTTTTVAELPPACADAIRTAEQSLALLDQTFQSARRLDVGELDRLLSELQEVRRGLTERVRACVERA